MVKRQTVWLSTMMVLSLMLIGYYTMNSNSGLPAQSSSGPDATATSVIPAPQQPDASGGAQTGSGAQTAGNSTGTSGQSALTPTSTDWYIDQQTKLDDQMSQQMDRLRTVLSNNNASSDQLSQAEQQLKQLQTLQGELQNARDMVVANGFKDCVIIPVGDYSKVTVYVKASKLSPDQAVQIMHTVSEQLNISAANVSVSVKS